MSAPVQTTNSTPSNTEVYPCNEALVMASRLAIQNEMPIHFDYYVPTSTGRAFIGEDAETKERVLLKGPEEFTSLIKKLGKGGNDIIVMTENSIYIISGKTMKKKVSMKDLHMADDEDDY
jgi:hypothetical protein